MSDDTTEDPACECRHGLRMTCPQHGEGLADLLAATEKRHRGLGYGINIDDDGGPIRLSEDELAMVLAGEIGKILGNNITSDAHDRRDYSGLTPADLLINVHLFERLGTAYEAIRALRGYEGKPRGFRKAIR